MLIILFDQDVVTLSSFKIGRKGAKRTQIDTVFDVTNSYDETYDSIKPTARLTLLLHELIRREGCYIHMSHIFSISVKRFK